MQQDMRGLDPWVAWLGTVDIPVLRQTTRDLAQLRENANRLDARSVAHVVMRDPMMTVKLLRHFQRYRAKGGLKDVVQIERMLLMMGLEAFFANVPPRPVVEDVLRGDIDALTSLLRGVRRAHRGAHYAAAWAVMLHDLHFDEVRAAAQLHDLAGLLMWCFAPDRMVEIRRAQRKDRSLRSKDAQEAAFGFTLSELQTALATQWGLPELLLTLMDDACAGQPRVRNVVLAVNLARHSDNGWNDAALPDDFREIGQLLRMPPEQVMELVGAPIDTAATGVEAVPGNPAASVPNEPPQAV